MEDSASLSSDQPRILYQCGDCEELFKSLHLWQQHRREETCQQPAPEERGLPESQPEQQTIFIQSSQSVLNSDESILVNESNQEPQPEAAEESLAGKEPEAETPVAQSSEQFSEAASSAANPEDSSPRKRGANKKPKPEPVLLCVDCGSCFGLVSELVAHRKTQHGFEEALHRCTVCGECFLNTTLFLYHRKQHKQLGEAAEAPPDASAFSSGFLLEQRDEGAPSLYRVSTSLLEKSCFFCTLCGESFGDGAEFAIHREQKHDLLEPLHSCHCGESFMNTTQYLYHRRQHGVEAGLGMAEENVPADESAPSKPEDTPQGSKRLLSPSASTSEAFSPIPKRGRPSFRISSSSLKGKPSILSHPCLRSGSLIRCLGLPGSKAPRDDSEGSAAADSDHTNHPPPAKLLQDWARTPLPHVCPYCGKTFTRRIFLRTHVYRHTGEKLFTCKVTIRVSLSFRSLFSPPI